MCHARDVRCDCRQHVVAADEKTGVGIKQTEMIFGVAGGVDCEPLTSGETHPVTFVESSGRMWYAKDARELGVHPESRPT